jgi:hypothetical protein
MGLVVKDTWQLYRQKIKWLIVERQINNIVWPINYTRREVLIPKAGQRI